MEKIALLGATGSLGRALGQLLGAAGTPYRAVSRSQMGLQVRMIPGPMAEPVLWDPEQPASILNALEGVDTAIYLVGMPLWEFEKHIALTERVLTAAATAGVRRLLLVSSNWACGIPAAQPADAAPGDLSQAGVDHVRRINEQQAASVQTVKGAIRSQQEKLVEKAHQAGALQTAILRCADFYGPHVEASYLWSAFKAARNHGHAQVMRPADRPHEFVYVPDAARTIVHMLATPALWESASGRAWNLGGVEVTTLRAMVEAIFAAAGQPPNYEIPPAWKMRVVAMLNPYVRAMREMQYLLETPVLLDDAALSKVLGGLEKTAYQEGIAQTLPTVRIGR